MSDIYLRKYGVANTIDFVLHEVDGVDLRVDAVAASGDSKLMKDEGAEANTANLFVDEGQGYSLALTAAELTAARVVVYLVDSATKAWLDRELIIETYGNASAQHAQDFDSTVPTAVENRQEMDTESVQLAQISGDVIAVSGDVLTIDTEVGLISGDVESILADTNEMQGKLPANKFMGSSDGADDDGTLNTILTDVGKVSGDLNVVSGDVVGVKTVTDALPNSGALSDIDTGVNNIETAIIANAAGADVSADIAVIKTDIQQVSGDLIVVSGDVVTIDGKVDVIDTEVGLISGDVANLVASEGEPAQGTPPVTATINDKVSHMYKFMRNKVITTSGDIIVRNDADSVDDHKSIISGDGTTFTRGEFGTG